jgi:Cys-rich protein (TIGR04453 family)
MMTGVTRLLPWLVLLLSLVACKKEGKDADCRATCLRVSRCRQEARVGKPILGEGELPPDARCMKRCVDEPEVWASCEASRRRCSELRDCYGPLR